MEQMSKETFSRQDTKSPDDSRPVSVEDQRNDIEKDDNPLEVIDDEKGVLSIKSSKQSTYESLPIVPRHLRRGILARFALVSETTEPTRYPRRTKWTITFV